MDARSAEALTGFRQTIHRTRSERRRAVARVRGDEYRPALAPGAYRAQYLDARHVRQLRIDQHQVGTEHVRGFDRFGSGRRPDRRRPHPLRASRARPERHAPRAHDPRSLRSRRTPNGNRRRPRIETRPPPPPSQWLERRASRAESRIRPWIYGVVPRLTRRRRGETARIRER